MEEDKAYEYYKYDKSIYLKDGMKKEIKEFLTKLNKRSKELKYDKELTMWVKQLETGGYEYKVTQESESDTQESTPYYVSVFYTRQFMGCCGIMIASNISLNTNNERFNEVLLSYVVTLLKKLTYSSNYTQLLVTDTDYHIRKLKEYKKQDFKKISEFKNNNSGNLVEVLAFTYGYNEVRLREYKDITYEEK